MINRSSLTHTETPLVAHAERLLWSRRGLNPVPKAKEKAKHSLAKCDRSKMQRLAQEVRKQRSLAP
jgi:hypothetical protein